jgi:hypothetical protein
MTGWLDKLRGRRPEPQALTRWLADYPPFTPPFPDWGLRLSMERARANLDHLLAHRPGRLELVTRFLGEFGLDAGGALAEPDPRAFLDALWRWAQSDWVDLPSPWRAAGDASAWRASRRAGPDIMLSLLGDIGLLLGEIVLVRRPDYAWALNDDPEDQEIGFWRQPEVIKTAPKPGLMPRIIEFDMAGLAVHVFEQIKAVTTGLQNEMLDAVSDAVLGQTEQMWIAENAVIGEAPTWDEWLQSARLRPSA